MAVPLRDYVPVSSSDYTYDYIGNFASIMAQK